MNFQTQINVYHWIHWIFLQFNPELLSNSEFMSLILDDASEPQLLTLLTSINFLVNFFSSPSSVSGIFTGLLVN